MKYVYPIILIPSNGEYVVRVPDFDFMTQGKDIADAIDMARDAISLMGVEYQDKGKTLPLVDVDCDAYRKMLENRTVRKNCTSPSWLNEKAEQAGINFSAVLQKGLKEELNLA